MQTNTFNVSFLRYTLACLSLVLLSPISFAIDSIKFTNSNVSIKMHKADWDIKSISYSNKYKNADLSISLDQQQYPYLQPLIEQFSLQRNKVIAISDGTCGVSAGKLRRKEIDVGGFCCPPGKLDRLPELRFHTLGIASLALIANKDVQVNNVTIDQAKKIFSGDLKSWGEVSLNKADTLSISPIVRPHCDKRPGHWRLIAPKKSSFSHNKFLVGSIPDMLKRTAKIPGAVGYETLWMVDQYKNREPVKVLKIDGLNPQDSAALAKGEYPFYRTFSVTTWGEKAKPLAKELVAYLIKHIKSSPNGKHTLIGVDQLKENGWQFNGDELIAEPNNMLYSRR